MKIGTLRFFSFFSNPKNLGFSNRFSGPVQHWPVVRTSPSRTNLNSFFLCRTPLQQRQPATNTFCLPSVTVNGASTFASPTHTTYNHQHTTTTHLHYNVSAGTAQTDVKHGAAAWWTQQTIWARSKFRNDEYEMSRKSELLVLVDSLHFYKISLK